MFFVPPSWAPQLPDPPDSITIDEFINSEQHGRCPFASARHPYVCGLSGLSRSAAEVARRTELLARAIAERLSFSASRGSPWDRVVAVFSLNTTAKADAAHMEGSSPASQIDYIPLTLAVHRLSGIVTPVNAAYSADELQYQLRSSGARALFTCLPLLTTALQAARAVVIPEQHVFLMPMPASDPATRLPLISLDDLVAEGQRLPPSAPLRWKKHQGARQTAYLCYSSGTSGLPKGVMISHYNVIASTAQVSLAESVPRKALDITTQTSLGALPFSHIYGLALVGLAGHYRGDQIVVLPRFDLAAALAAAEAFRIRQLFVVPPILVQMTRQRDLCAKYDLSSVRWVFCGAAPLGAELIQTVLSLYPHWRLGQGYGMTEASPGIFCTIETDCLPGSSGSLLPGVTAKLVDANGYQVTQLDTRGELLVQSPSVVQGYLDNEKANVETFVWDDDGRWLRTGDEVLVRLSSQGHQHFFVTDRIKELIKVKGHQVAPAELEAHLLLHPLVSDCAVVAVPDEAAGEVPKAFVVKSPEAAGLSDAEATAAICDHVQRYKARYKWLKGGIDFIDLVPKSPSGKILRRLLKNREVEVRRAKAARL